MWLKSFRIILIFLVIISCQDNKNLLPEQIDTWQLSKKLTGDEAKSFVNNLHFSKVTDEPNEIAFYNTSKGQIMIYLTYYDLSESAQQNYTLMTEKISTENSVFRFGKYLNIEGTEIYRCFGMGQTHFVFVHKDILVWMSVPTMGNESYLRTYLDYMD